jgi:type II secretory pathway pseudopilin PulG
MKSANPIQSRRAGEAGMGMIDLMIAACVMGVVTCFAVVNITSARAGMRLSTSAQVLSAYMDKARLAAIRCHCSTTVQISSTTGYTVTGPLKSGTTETLDLSLEPGVAFSGITTPLTITFDWRGRPDNDYHLTLGNTQGTRKVDLSGGGDVKIDSTADYTYAPTIHAELPTDLSDAATDSYVTSFANNNTNTVVVNPKNHKKPKKK